jgi:peptide/nickel transport system permease protein
MASVSVADATSGKPRRSQGLTVVRAVARSRSAAVGLLIVLTLILVAVLAPTITSYSPIRADMLHGNLPPSRQHPFGTDAFGRDILSRVVWGSRLSLVFGAGAVVVGSTCGISMGLLAGYVRSFDSFLMRIIDILIAFRLLLLAIAIMAILGPGLLNTMLAIGISLFASFARVTRGEVLVAKERDYVEAARAMGAGVPRVIVAHILPNISGPLIVLCTLRLGEAILAEASLSFLGLGPNPPTPSWGLMVYDGLSLLRQAPWVCLIPGTSIMVAVLGFNLFGDGLRDILDPRLRGVR